MEIRVRHPFPCSPSRYWEIVTSPGYDEELRKNADVELTVLSREEKDGKLHERLRISPRKELPTVMQKATGAKRLSYVQELVSDPKTLTIAWKVLSDVMPEKVSASGTTTVTADGGGCVRDLRGDVKVAIPLVGGTIEKHIVAEIEASYTRAADVIRRRIREG